MLEDWKIPSEIANVVNWRWRGYLSRENHMELGRLFESLLLIEKVEPPYNVDWRGEKLGCDDSMCGWESEFCSEELWYVRSKDRHIHSGFTWVCSRHLLTSTLQFALSIQERVLHREFNDWQDERAKAQMELSDAEEQSINS